MSSRLSQDARATRRKDQSVTRRVVAKSHETSSQPLRCFHATMHSSGATARVAIRVKGSMIEYTLMSYESTKEAPEYVSGEDETVGQGKKEQLSLTKRPLTSYK